MRPIESIMMRTLTYFIILLALAAPPLAWSKELYGEASKLCVAGALVTPDGTINEELYAYCSAAYENTTDQKLKAKWVPLLAEADQLRNQQNLVISTVTNTCIVKPLPSLDKKLRQDAGGAVMLNGKKVILGNDSQCMDWEGIFGIKDLRSLGFDGAVDKILSYLGENGDAPRNLWAKMAYNGRLQVATDFINNPRKKSGSAFDQMKEALKAWAQAALAIEEASVSTLKAHATMLATDAGADSVVSSLNQDIRHYSDVLQQENFVRNCTKKNTDAFLVPPAYACGQVGGIVGQCSAAFDRDSPSVEFLQARRQALTNPFAYLLTTDKMRPWNGLFHKHGDQVKCLLRLPCSNRIEPLSFSKQCTQFKQLTLPAQSPAVKSSLLAGAKDLLHERESKVRHLNQIIDKIGKSYYPPEDLIKELEWMGSHQNEAAAGTLIMQRPQFSGWLCRSLAKNAEDQEFIRRSLSLISDTATAASLLSLATWSLRGVAATTGKVGAMVGDAKLAEMGARGVATIPRIPAAFTTASIETSIWSNVAREGYDWLTAQQNVDELMEMYVTSVTQPYDGPVEERDSLVHFDGGFLVSFHEAQERLETARQQSINSVGMGIISEAFLRIRIVGGKNPLDSAKHMNETADSINRLQSLKTALAAFEEQNKITANPALQKALREKTSQLIRRTGTVNDTFITEMTNWLKTQVKN